MLVQADVGNIARQIYAWSQMQSILCVTEELHNIKKKWNQNWNLRSLETVAVAGTGGCSIDFFLTQRNSIRLPHFIYQHLFFVESLEMKTRVWDLHISSKLLVFQWHSLWSHYFNCSFLHTAAYCYGHYVFPGYSDCICDARVLICCNHSNGKKAKSNG